MAGNPAFEDASRALDSLSGSPWLPGCDAVELLRDFGDAGDRSVGRIEEIGRSRRGRPIVGARVGSGPRRLSIVAGAHADEPVGSATLERLLRWLHRGSEDARRWLERCTLSIVPNANPDGAAVNAAWSHRLPWRPGPYFDAVVRELPGDDVEFGYPGAAELRGEPEHEGAPPLRPENLAIARFLEAGAPYDAHLSLHGMAIAEGVWCLIDEASVASTRGLRRDLRAAIEAEGLPLHDQDRNGEKGFRGIEPGFSTTPTSTAMRQHFLALGDAAEARKFRPSSMELVAGFGGSPLAMVSEIPLFLIRRVEPEAPGVPASFLRVRELLPAALAARAAGDDDPFAKLVENYGFEPVPIEVAVRLQWTMIRLAVG